MHQGIYDRLLQLARAVPGQLTTYSEIAPIAGLSMDSDADRDAMAKLLGEILRTEVENDRPLLTALVVHRGNDNNPGEGFFSLAAELGHFGGSRDPFVRLQFWSEAVQAVFTYWRSH